MPRHRKIAIALAALYALAFALVQSCSEKPAPPPAVAITPATFTKPLKNPHAGVAFTGSHSCSSCHGKAHADWLASDHHKAMLLATAENVLGDFDDNTFTHFGREFRFFKKDAAFYVNAEDEDGQRQDYKIDYTFGFDPLQQYLIKFPGGRYQALHVCWDSRPEADGGQRWYHLYPDEEIPPSDELHWTRQHFNWNYMCADCHSTKLEKNYDPDTDTYDTTYAEMNVSCEACHGPGENHLKWARSPSPNLDPTMGLVVQLKEPGEPATWSIDPDTLKPVRSKPLDSTVQVETCARCHAHRRPVQDNFYHGQDFLDTHALTTPNPVHYHPDGQIKEEVYVYGSFVQSKMYHNGVRCTDCHHHHTMKPLAPGNALCFRCHIPTKYDTPDHHHHKTDSTGASCTACHMPHKTYMGVDDRLDHSIRVPRPDLSDKNATPNACTNCHTDQTNSWAATAALEWWGETLTDHPEYVTAFAKNTPTALTSVLKTPAFPAIVRAAALDALAPQLTADRLTVVTANLTDPAPSVRAAAVGALDALPPDRRLPHVLPLLQDPARTVRLAAARSLAPANRAALTKLEKQAFASAIDEYVNAQSAVYDRPGGHMALAILYTDLAQPELAEKHYRDAYRIDPAHIPSRINLAELLQNTNRTAEAQTLLETAVRSDPANSIAHESLGRLHVRQKNYDEGVAHLKLAADLDPARPGIQYFYGVALNSLGNVDDAIPYLQRAADLAPNNPEFLLGLTTVTRDARRFDLAIPYAERLLALDPTNPNYQQLRQQLEFLSSQ